MSDKSAIEWTDATWNPTTGCSKISDGCKNCYAERVTARFRKDNLPWTLQNAAHNVVLHPERLEIPLRWQKPRRVFVDSMSDLFHERIPFEFIYRVFGTMALASRHTFQVLTKRPARMAKFFEWATGTWGESLKDDPRHEVGTLLFPFRNVWLGVSVEDQEAADERIPHLLKVPARVRFLSCEPLLGELNLTDYLSLNGMVHHRGGYTPAVNWVIVGGESGPGARPIDSYWVRKLRAQCINVKVPFFFKQWGEYDEAGKRVGKAKAGRLLDGVEWNEYPQVAEVQR